MSLFKEETCKRCFGRLSVEGAYGPSTCPRCKGSGIEPPDLSDPTEPRVQLSNDATETSHHAALSARPRSGTQRARVLRAIKDAGLWGCTAEELQVELKLSGDSVRPRLIELRQGKWIETHTMRSTAAGNQAEVWVLSPAGSRELKGW